jgi:hypothetical protein
MNQFYEPNDFPAHIEIPYADHLILLQKATNFAVIQCAYCEKCTDKEHVKRMTEVLREHHITITSINYAIICYSLNHEEPEENVLEEIY